MTIEELRALGSRSGCEWRCVPHLSAENPRTNPGERRHGHHVQSVGAQGCRCQRGHRSNRRQAALFTTLLTRPEPDRDDVRQAQSPSEKSCQTKVDGPWQAIGDILNQFTPNECRNYLQTTLKVCGSSSDHSAFFLSVEHR